MLSGKIITIKLIFECGVTLREVTRLQLEQGGEIVAVASQNIVIFSRMSNSRKNAMIVTMHRSYADYSSFIAKFLSIDG